MRRLFLLFAVALLLAAASPVRAEILGDARVPFSADRSLVVDGAAYPGKTYSMPGRQRHEVLLLGMPHTLIVDATQAQGWLVMPLLKSYVPFTFAPAAVEMNSQRVKKTRVGAETVNGIATVKYKIDQIAKDGTEVAGYAWISADGIVMKLDGSVASAKGTRPIDFRMELTNLQLGPQNPTLFQLPGGLNRLPFESLQPLLKPRAG